MKGTLRPEDFVARYGGDEFVVLRPDGMLGAAEAALTHTVKAVDQLPEGLSRSVKLSVGVAAMRPQDSAVQVLERADTASYQAKRAGGNRVVVSKDGVPALETR